MFRGDSLLARVLTLRRIIIAAINLFLLIAFVVCIAVSNSLVESLRSQQAATAWTGQSEERFAQVSAFFPTSVDFNVESIFELRSSVDDALRDASFEAPAEGRLYADAWSVEGEFGILAPGEQSFPVSAAAIGVGGDFFIFHPLRLRDGSYITPHDFARDRILLDEDLAWGLFGGVELTGLDILVNGRPFVVGGVVLRDDDFASRRAYTDGPGFFMSFEAFVALTEGDDPEGVYPFETSTAFAGNSASISTYKIVMPDPISGFAWHTIRENIDDDRVHVVENSARFSLENSFRAIGAFGERSIWNESISFPYWENAARFTEDWLALLLLLALVFIAFPLVCAIFYTVKLIIFCVNAVIKYVKWVTKRRDQRKYREFVEAQMSVGYDS